MLDRNRLLSLLLSTVLVSLSLIQTANADKEGGLSLHSAMLDSPGMTDFGPVHVEMKRSDEGIESLVISAFGRNETAPPQLLRSIKEKKWLNGVQLSWSRGYPLTGGRTVYVSLTEGGSWGALVLAVIGFSEDGKFRIFDNLSREEAKRNPKKARSSDITMSPTRG